MNNGSLNPDWWAYFERYPLPKPYPPYEEDSSPESQSEYEDESGDDDLKQQDKSENRARQAREQHDIVEYVRQSQSNPHKNLQNQERYRRKKMDWYQDRIIAWMNESSSWTRMDDIDYYKYYNGHYKSIVDQRMLHWLQQQLLDIESKSQMAQMTQSKQCILLCELGQLLFETWMNRHRDRDNETEHSELAMHSLCSILDLPLRLSYARAYVLLADILAYSEWATSGEEAVLLHLAAMHGYSEALVRLYSNYVRCLDHDVVRIAVQEKNRLRPYSHALNCSGRAAAHYTDRQDYSRSLYFSYHSTARIH